MARPDSSRRARTPCELRVRDRLVLVVARADNRDDGAEDLLLDDLVLVPRADEHGRVRKKPFAGTSGARASDRLDAPAGERALDEAADALALRGRDERADVHAGREAVADPHALVDNALHRRRDLLDEPRGRVDARRGVAVPPCPGTRP